MHSYISLLSPSAHLSCLMLSNPPFVFFSLYLSVSLCGKVKVMMRICPSLEAADSSESQSFLKVDSRKKQLTLYDPASSPHSSSGHRRSATVAVPKIFAFDAVFTQDASQVRASKGCTICVFVCVCKCFFLNVSCGNRPLKGKGTSFCWQGVARGLEKKCLSWVRGHSYQCGPNSWAF